MMGLKVVACARAGDKNINMDSVLVDSAHFIPGNTIHPYCLALDCRVGSQTACCR